MNATKILWGQVLAVSAVVLAFLWGATQWVAWSLAFQPQLGHPWFNILGWPVYDPTAFFWWWFAYDAYARPIFVEGAYIAASGGIAAVVVAIAMSVWRAREAKKVTTYGSAHWAETHEVRQAGLLCHDGVMLGRWRHEYLRHDGPEHVLCFAPTRSGKGVGLVVPTLLTWPESAIVHDIKGENWTLTAGWRARFGRVLLFDPTNAASAAYDPLLEVRKGEWEVRDAQNIADVLVDPEGALERRNHWEKTSHSLLVGAMLHVLYAEPDKTLAGVANFLSDPRRPIETTLRAMLTTPQPWRSRRASRCGQLRTRIAQQKRQRALGRALDRDVVPRAISRSRRRGGHAPLRLAHSRPLEGKTATTLYLVVPPSDISRTKPLVRLILNQIGRRLTEDLEAKQHRHRLLLMLDEFPALGRLDFFELALAFMAGYGLKSFLIAQSLNQIEKAYGQNNSILDNCHVRVSFATNDERTAKRVSDALGTATEMRAMKNYAGHRLSPWLGHLMVSRQETARPLLTPGEVMQLPPADELILVSGLPPDPRKEGALFRGPRDEGPHPATGRSDSARAAPGRTNAAPPRRADWNDAEIAPSAAAVEDPANAGIRREPELPEHEEIVAEPRKPVQEFEPLEDETDDEVQRQRTMQRNFGAATRQTTLDRADDLGM